MNINEAKDKKISTSNNPKRYQGQNIIQLNMTGDHYTMGQQHGRQHPLPLRLQRACHHGRHGVAGEAENDGNHRPAAQADALEAPVHQECQAREVAAVLEDAEEEEEGGETPLDEEEGSALSHENGKETAMQTGVPTATRMAMFLKKRKNPLQPFQKL